MSDTPPTNKEGTEEKENVEEPKEPAEDPDMPEGYRSLGKYDPFVAAGYLRRFEQEGIRFLIDKVEDPLSWGTGSRKRAWIQICVHRDDEERAGKIMNEDVSL